MTDLTVPEMVALVEEFDLGPVTDTTSLIEALLAQRAFQLGTLAANDGTVGPSATGLAIRAARRAEVERVEAVLTRLGVEW